MNTPLSVKCTQKFNLFSRYDSSLKINLTFTELIVSKRAKKLYICINGGISEH